MLIKTKDLSEKHSYKENSVSISSLSVDINMVTFTFSNWLYAKLFATANDRSVEEIKSRNKMKTSFILLSIAHPIKNVIFVLSVSLVALIIFSNIFATKAPSIPTFNEPTVQMPSNSSSENLTNNRRQAPLKIKTPNGNNYYYILLKNSNTNKTEITVFAYPGSTVDIKVPLGKYAMYYASGDTWYGKNFLFGPQTVYSKADDIFDFYVEGNSIMGHTVELIKQSGGNLTTSGADKSQFND